MQLSNAPGKLLLPFANAGAKNTIPTASQIGITAGAASLTDGFPPLTRTPIAAGGVPPSGLDMNGILYALSAALRWANAGGGYIYDGTFAADSNVGGYPKGARVLRSDGLGYWFNTTDNNTTDPEGVGAVAAGWVPDFTNGVAAVTMTGSNVTLTALQYGKPVIIISGQLTTNLNLIFPSIAGEWAVINNTTGAYSITCKTAAGTGVVVNSAQAIVGDGTNIYSAVNDAISLLGKNVASAGGTADALTATFAPAPRVWSSGVPFFVRAASANATATPTFTPNSGTLTAKTIVKGANGALAVGDIAGAGHWLVLQYDSTLDKVVLLNPANGINAVSVKQLQSITATVASNALTLGLNPTSLDFRSSSLTSGVPNTLTVGAAISLVVPSGATLGTVSATAARLALLAIDNGGTVELAVVNLAGGNNLDETTLISTTAISAAATARNVIYSTTARTNVPFRVVGFVDITEATAGTWATSPTVIQGQGGQAMAAMSSLGYGQTWRDLTGSRALGTTYYNTTGRPILVNVNVNTVINNGTFNITVDGVVAAQTTIYSENQCLSAIVPNGATYVASSANMYLSTWSELR